MTSETNAAGAMTSMFDPNWPAGSEDGHGDRARVARRRSAPPAGRSRSTGTGRWPARRSPAARGAGSTGRRCAPRRRRRCAPTRGCPWVCPTKKLRNRKIANGSPNAVWKRTSPSTVSTDPEVVVEGEDRDQRHLHRHHQQRDDGDEEPVAPGELEPGEGVAGHRSDEDRHDGPADRDLEPSCTSEPVMSLLWRIPR